MSRKKSPIDKALGAASKAVKKAAGKGVRAAVDKLRVKPDTMLRDMRAAGWTPTQIEARTGITPRAQNNVLAGRATGARYVDALRQARRGGGRTAPPPSIAPVAAARGQVGAGRVRQSGGKTVITVGPGVDPAWLDRQIKAARGKVVVRQRADAVRGGQPGTAGGGGAGRPPGGKPPRAVAGGGGGSKPPTPPRRGAAAPPPEPPRPERRDNKLVMKESDAIENALKGGRSKTQSWYQKVRDVLRKHKDDRDAAAGELGVTRKTIDKYLNKDPKKRGNPSKAVQKKIDGARDSRTGRAGYLPKKRMNRLKRDGMKVKLNGKVRINNDPKYDRVRAIAMDLPPADAERVIDAFVEGGPAAAYEVLSEILAAGSNGGAHSFEFLEMTEFGIEDRTEYDRLMNIHNDRDD